MLCLVFCLLFCLIVDFCFVVIGCALLMSIACFVWRCFRCLLFELGFNSVVLGFPFYFDFILFIVILFVFVCVSLGC